MYLQGSVTDKINKFMCHAIVNYRSETLIWFLDNCHGPWTVYSKKNLGFEHDSYRPKNPEFNILTVTAVSVKSVTR